MNVMNYDTYAAQKTLGKTIQISLFEFKTLNYFILQVYLYTNTVFNIIRHFTI